MRTWWLLPLCLAACDATDPQAPVPSFGATTQIVPSAALPDEYRAVAGPSNNNLDVMRHQGRVFLAVRTAPDHFASPEARLLVFSSTDERNWQYEALFHLQTDLREPRFLSFKGRLFLYFAQLGTNSTAFDPQGMLMSEYQGPGNWSAPRDTYGTGRKLIPWRFVIRDGRAYLTLYDNGQRIYDFSGLPIDIELLVSDDGVSWQPAGTQAIVSTGGGSETAFAFDSRGDLYAVIRNERGDETGWGSKICRARKDALGDWTCMRDLKKYDSPLMFVQDDTVYLIGRRHLSATGNYQEDPTETWSLPGTINYLIAYSGAPKRCSLWQVDRATLTVRFLTDVPGTGDTCFPSVLEDPTNPRARILYNYSSPLDGPDLTWMQGQRGETRIYRTDVNL
jgi:hypothetical protein